MARGQRAVPWERYSVWRGVERAVQHRVRTVFRFERWHRVLAQRLGNGISFGEVWRGPRGVAWERYFVWRGKLGIRITSQSRIPFPPRAFGPSRHLAKRNTVPTRRCRALSPPLEAEYRSRGAERGFAAHRASLHQVEYGSRDRWVGIRVTSRNGIRFSSRRGGALFVSHTESELVRPPAVRERHSASRGGWQPDPPRVGTALSFEGWRGGQATRSGNGIELREVDGARSAPSGNGIELREVARRPE